MQPRYLSPDRIIALGYFLDKAIECADHPRSVVLLKHQVLRASVYSRHDYCIVYYPALVAHVS